MLKKKLYYFVLASIITICVSLSFSMMVASAATFEDELGAQSTGTFENIFWAVDGSSSTYYGEGGDTTIRQIQTAGDKVSYGYVEYAVSNPTKISTSFYWLSAADIPYLSLDLTGSNAWSAWGDPNASLAPTIAQGAGDDIVFKYVDVDTGLLYVNVNGYWFVYCDEVNAEGAGWWSWLRIHDGVGSYPAPDVSKLRPLGGGFMYTINGTDWITCTPTITERHPNGSGKTWEVWESAIPETATKVRVFLSNRAVYATVYHPMTAEVPTFTTRATGASTWYNFFGKVIIYGKESQDPIVVTSSSVHTFGSSYDITFTGGSGTGAVTYEILADGTTGEGKLNGATLTAKKPGDFNIKISKAGDDSYGATSKTFVLTVSATGMKIFTDELDAQSTGTFENIFWAVDGSSNTYYGEGGDTSIRQIQTAGDKVSYGYVEYSVFHPTKISTSFYWLSAADIPYLSLDLTGSNAWSAWGDPNASLAPTIAQGAGDDIVFKYVDVDTGLLYVNVNGYWFVYCDEVNAEGAGWWSWLRIHDGVGSYPAPDVSKLRPLGGGFMYTINGTDWITCTPTITERHPNGSGKTWEVWESVIPETATKVRVFLSNRAVYATVYHPMTAEVPTFTTRATGASTWYNFFGDVMILSKDVKDDQAQLSVTSSNTHTFGTDYEITFEGGSGTGAVSYEIITEGSTGEATINGSKLVITKAGIIKFKVLKAGDDKYLSASTEEFTLTVNKGTQSGSISVKDIEEGEDLVVQTSATTVLYKVYGSDDSTYKAEKPTEVGHYTVKGVYPANDNYEELVVTKDFYIMAKPIAQDYIIVTSPRTHVIGTDYVVTFKGGSGNGEVSYRVYLGGTTGNGTFDGAKFTATKVGKVYIKVTKAGDGTYLSTSTIFLLTVVKGNYVGVLEVSNIMEGESLEVNTTAEVVLYKEKGSDDSTYTSVKPTAPGEYTVKAVYAETDYLNELVLTKDFVITPKPIEQTPIIVTSALSHKVGSDYEITFNGGNGQGTVTYEIVSDTTNGKTALNGNILSITKAGTVKIRIRKAGDDKYLPTSKEFEIEIVAKGATVVVDELGADSKATFNNIFNAVDGSGTIYYGAGGDTTIRQMETAGERVTFGYAEYSVSNATKISANFYWLYSADIPYLSLDLNGSNAWSAWGDPNASLAPTVNQGVGDDIVFKYVDVETGLLYVKVNGYWFVYCDEVNAEYSGWWSWLRIHDGLGSYPKPDESKLIPLGGGFMYTENGTDWITCNPTIVERHPNGSGKTWEVWESAIPETAIKVRVFLSSRAVYSTVYHPMTAEVPTFTHRANGISTWYNFIGKVSISEMEGQDPIVITSPSTHTLGSDYEITFTGGSGKGEVTYEILENGTTGIGVLKGRYLNVAKAGKFTIKVTKAADDDYPVASQILVLTVPKLTQTGSLEVSNITEGQQVSVKTTAKVVMFKVKGSDDSTYTTTIPSAAGEYTVEAVYTGDDNHEELVLVKDFKINARLANQEAIVVTSDSIHTFGTDYDITISGGNGNGEVTYEIYPNLTTGEGTLNGSKLTITKAGAFVVKISKAGDSTYAPTSTTFVLVVNKAQQEGSLNVSDITAGEELIVETTAGQVLYKVNGSDDSTYTSVKPTVAGDYTVKAVYAGDDNHVELVLTKNFKINVKLLQQTPITITSASTHKFGTDYVIAIEGGSGTGSITYEINSDRTTGKGYLRGNTLSIRKVGTFVINVKKDGDETYAPTATELVLVVEKGTFDGSLSVADVEEGVRVYVQTTGGKILFKVKGSDDSTYTESIPTTAGEYTVKVIYPADDNHEELVLTEDFNITEKSGKGCASSTASLGILALICAALVVKKRK